MSEPLLPASLSMVCGRQQLACQSPTSSGQYRDSPFETLANDIERGAVFKTLEGYLFF